MGRIILCPKCQHLLREPSPNKPYFECSNCSLVFHDKYVILPQPELFVSKDFSEEGNGKTIRWYNKQDSFSKLLDESNKQSISRIRSLSLVRKNSPLYIRRDPPQPQHPQVQTSFLRHPLSSSSNFGPIGSNEIVSPKSAISEQQACIQQVSELVSKKQLNDPQCLWLLIRLQLWLSPQNSRSCTKNTAASNVLGSFESVPSSVNDDGSEIAEQDEVDVKEVRYPSLCSKDKPLHVRRCAHCSSNNLTDIQEKISLGDKTGIFALVQIDTQDCEVPMKRANVLRAPSSTSLQDIVIISDRQSGSCVDLNSESVHQRESPKVTESTPAILPNSNALTGQALEIDNELTSNKKNQDKFQIFTGLETRPSFNRKTCLSCNGSSSSDDFVALSMMAKKMASSKQILSTKAPKNLFIHTSDNSNYQESLQATAIQDFSFTKFSGALPFSLELPLWGSPAGDLYGQKSSMQLFQTQTKAHMEGAAVRGIGQHFKCFLRSKKAKIKASHRHTGVLRGVYVNGEAIPDYLVEKAEELAGPIHTGSYWYDIFVGFWGVSGGPCLGIIMPGVEEFDHPLSRHCCGGSTSVLVNGRELHKLDLEKFVKRGLPSTPRKAYKIFFDGRVFDAASGVELHGLGKLAPTVERRGRGYGMFTSTTS